MNFRLPFVFLSALAFLSCAVPGKASLLGTSITGSLQFLGNASNYFDPANGYVPSTGYQNSSGTTVTITEPAIEFGAVFPANTDSANFTATQLTLTDVVNSVGNNGPFTVTFAGTGFLGLSLSKVSDTFTNGGTTATLTGNTLAITWNGGAVNAGTLQATYNLAAASPVPEPSSRVLLLTGVSAAGYLRRRRNALKQNN